MKFKVYTFLNQRLILSNGFECQFKDGVYETEDNAIIELLKKVPNVHCEKPSILQTIKNNGTLNNNSSEESSPSSEPEVVEQVSENKENEETKEPEQKEETSSVEQVEPVDNNSANETSKRGRPSKNK